MSAIENPRVSIGLPVYNSESFLAPALDSILEQSFSDYELIISDNGSTDGTAAICRDYAARDSRVRFIQQSEDIGMIPNFKFVLDESVGDYFMWLSGDDRKTPNFLDLAVKALDEEEAIGVVFCDTEIMDVTSGEKVGQESFGFTTSRIKWFKYLFRLHHGGGPALMYGLHRRKLLLQFDLYAFDYFDVHLCNWYEMSSQIRVLPLKMHIVGTVGKRVPYSLTGDRLDPTTYLKEQWRLLNANLNPLIAIIVYVLARYRITRDAKHSNKQILK
jgi:glycosyltransferase involved in cell wall biosynthesis